jgi:phosphate transport system permease protein
MSGVAAPPTPPAASPRPAATPPPRPRPVDSDPPWHLSDKIGLAIAWALGILFCLIAVALVLYLFVQGIKYVRPELLFTAPKFGYSQNTTGGFSDAIVGTVVVALLAMAIALPVGISVAVWLSEYGRPGWLARVVESTIEAIAGAPSIVLALFGTVIYSSTILGFLSRSSSDGVVFGRSFFAAGGMLSLVALPLVVGSVRAGLQGIPQHVREASYAAGKTKAATTRRVLLPACRPQVATGAMLGVGRVIGDTAIIVVLLGATLNFNKVGGVPGLNLLRGTGGTLTSYVFQNAPTGALNQPQKAYAAAFVLLLMVLALNVAVDIVHRRHRKQGSWNI